MRLEMDLQVIRAGECGLTLLTTVLLVSFEQTRHDSEKTFSDGHYDNHRCHEQVVYDDIIQSKAILTCDPTGRLYLK